MKAPRGSKLSDFAKELIRDCAEDRLNVYETYTIVSEGCTKSGYTIEQVGKYLRRVTKPVIRNPSTTTPKRPLRTYLPTSTPTQQTTTTKTKRNEERIEVFV